MQRSAQSLGCHHIPPGPRIPGLIHHEQYRERDGDRSRLQPPCPIERLIITGEDGVLRVELQRLVAIGFYDWIPPTVVHEEWAGLTEFSAYPENLRTSAALWLQTWIHTGKREYGERIPEA